MQVHRDHERVARERGRGVDWGTMDWERVARGFNARFEGRVLDGGEGVGVPRPRRTVAGLRRARGRVGEIVDMTGEFLIFSCDGCWV